MAERIKRAADNINDKIDRGLGKLSGGTGLAEAIDARVEREVAARTGSVEPTVDGLRVPSGCSAPSGDKLVSFTPEPGYDEPRENPDYIPGTASPGTSAGTSAPTPTEASGNPGRPGPSSELSK
jgi:hypothetical protein